MFNPNITNNSIYTNISKDYDKQIATLNQKQRRYYNTNNCFNKEIEKQISNLKLNKELSNQKIIKVPTKSTYVKMSQAYGDELMNMGFNHHSIFRFKYKDRESQEQFSRGSHTEKVQQKTTSFQLDKMMNYLSKHRDIELIWACIEPDIDKVSRAIDRYSNHVHFAYKTKSEINKRLLAKYMCTHHVNVREPQPIRDSMKYFTKHIGKSLTYHNIYA